MKKVFLGLGIVLGTMAFAQSTAGPRFGIKAGGNLSDLANSDAKSKIGFYAGAFMNAQFLLNSAFSQKLYTASKVLNSEILLSKVLLHKIQN